MGLEALSWTCGSASVHAVPGRPLPTRHPSLSHPARQARHGPQGAAQPLSHAPFLPHDNGWIVNWKHLCSNFMATQCCHAPCILCLLLVCLCHVCIFYSLNEGKECFDQVLERIRGTKNVDAEFADMQDAVELSKLGNWRKLFTRQHRPQLTAALLIPFFQQFTGVCTAHCVAPLCGKYHLSR